MNNNFEKIKKYISNIKKYQIKKEESILINYKLLNEDINDINKDLISHLIKDKLCKELFFDKIEDIYIFNQNKFIEVIFNTNEYMENSYTKYENKVGLFLKDQDTVQLNFPYKDCVLIGGMDKEDDKVNLEVFYNEILEKDKINKLFEPKVFHNIKKFSYSKDLAENDKLDNPNNIQVDTDISKINFNQDKIKDNLLIKGNNLLGLHSLARRLNGSIDVIYIDPPYYFNGKKSADSFAYNSNFKLSTWLTFMKNRLEIAKELLSEEGVIFISMIEDGNSHLKLLCNEIFGVDNFISNIIWDKNNNSETDQYFQTNNESILTYKNKIKKNDSFNDYKETTKEIILKNNKYYRVGSELLNGNVYLNIRDTLGYSIYYNPKTNDIIPLEDYDKEKAKIENDFDKIYKEPNNDLLKKGYICIRPPKKQNGIISCWTWSFKKAIKDKDLIYIERKNNGGFKVKGLTEVSENLVDKEKMVIKSKERIAPRNILKFNNGTKILSSLIGGGKFNNPKPVDMISYLIKVTANKNAIILDFFAGSGTTAHSVLDLNKEDGGNRKFILLEQMDYIENLTAERIKRAMIKEGYEDSFIYMEMKESDIKELKNNIKSSTSKEELLSLINDNFDNGFFINIDNKEQLLLKIEEIYLKSTKKSNPLNDSIKLVIEKYMDNNIDYISYEDIEGVNIKENELKLNKSFYEGK